jgi:hypothetical protein
LAESAIGREQVWGRFELEAEQSAENKLVFGGFEELRKRSLVEIFSLRPDGLDLRGVVNVGERIGAERSKTRLAIFPGSMAPRMCWSAEKILRAN